MNVVDGSSFVRDVVHAWPEKKLQAEIIGMAVGSRTRPSPLGWRAYHSYFSDRSEAGWPDLVLVRDRIIYAELKTMKGRLTRAQEEWRDALVFAGATFYLWRPCCWLSGEIEQVLL